MDDSVQFIANEKVLTSNTTHSVQRAKIPLMSGLSKIHKPNCSKTPLGSIMSKSSEGVSKHIANTFNILVINPKFNLKSKGTLKPVTAVDAEIYITNFYRKLARITIDRNWSFYRSYIWS